MSWRFLRDASPVRSCTSKQLSCESRALLAALAVRPSRSTTAGPASWFPPTIALRLPSLYFRYSPIEIDRRAWDKPPMNERSASSAGTGSFTHWNKSTNECSTKVQPIASRTNERLHNPLAENDVAYKNNSARDKCRQRAAAAATIAGAKVRARA